MARYTTTTARHWDSIDRARARLYEHHQHQANERAKASREVEAVRNERGAVPVRSSMADVELRELADRRAELMASRITADRQPRDVEGYAEWIDGQVRSLDARGARLTGKGTDAQQLEGLIARVQCPLWWRRQLRRAAARKREAEGIARAEVCATRRQPYVTTDTVRRHIGQKARNAEMLAGTEIESACGQVITLATAAASSTSNKAIRRGELMTRITGCERLADAAGHAGVFITATCPSRFHATLRHGELNPKFREAGPPPPDAPRRAQAWLCAVWARARAALQRLGVPMYGFRVAEPHHDGCPHWHMLLWTTRHHVERLTDTLRRYWLSDGGSEPGAAEHRLTAKAMRSGEASGYVAKYIAKNIDDAGALGEEGHRDDYDGEAVPMPAQGDLFGGGAQRVEAWASAWGIRQFQAIGQPPVTPWRELRRVQDAGELLGASHRTCRAWIAAHRDGEKRADWAGYVEAQGGLMLGRFYAVRVAEQQQLCHGRYESIERPRPVGLVDPSEPHIVVRSDRRAWRPKGTWRQDERRAPKAPTLTRTRFNNCTRRANGPTRVGGVVLPAGAPLRTWKEQLRHDEAPPSEAERMRDAWSDRIKRTPNEQHPSRAGAGAGNARAVAA